MNETTARVLLEQERVRIRRLLADQATSLEETRSTRELIELDEAAEALTAHNEGEAVLASLRERLGSLARAEQRLDEGTYGFSVRSGDIIDDERLLADPAAELTYDEAQNERAHYLDERADEV